MSMSLYVGACYDTGCVELANLCLLMCVCAHVYIYIEIYIYTCARARVVGATAGFRCHAK